MRSTEHDRGVRTIGPGATMDRPHSCTANPNTLPAPQPSRAYALNVRIGENRAITDTVPSSTWDWITWPISL
ncbi:hypothetical protein QF008_001937 [Pseudomonas protegens]|jgi:hypothetical protein|nr:hypothetical protein [Pseudomonas protegens]